MQPHPFGNDSAVSLCPLTYFRDNPEMEGKAFFLHMNWTKGILPSPGSLDDQAAGYSGVITATETGVVAGQKRQQEIHMRKAERQSGRGRSQKKSHSLRKR